MIAFLLRADSFERPKSFASLYLLRQQQLSTTHRTVYQSGSSLKRVISTLMAHKSQTSTASFSGTSSSVQASTHPRASDWAWQSADLLLSLLKCQRLMALWSIKLLSALWFLPSLLRLLHAQIFLSDGPHHSALFIVGVIWDSLTELIFNFRRLLKVLFSPFLFIFRESERTTNYEQRKQEWYYEAGFELELPKQTPRLNI